MDPEPSTEPRIRRLNEVELASYDVLPRDLARRVQVIRVPDLPGRYTGLSLGRFVFLAVPTPADGRNALLCHELVHVRQWSDQGVVGFSFRYVTDFVRGYIRLRNWNEAYLAIGAEVEARVITLEWAQVTARRRPEPVDAD
ncbi:MAG: hypothetical protein AAF467_23590 [Actinomycetota bacterium]